MQSACFLQSIPSHPCFTATCLTHSCLRTCRHLFLHLVRRPLLRCPIHRRVCPLPLARRVYALADWLNSPLSHNTCLWQQLTKLPAILSLRTSIRSSAKTLNQQIFTFTFKQFKTVARSAVRGESYQPRAIECTREHLAIGRNGYNNGCNIVRIIFKLGGRRRERGVKGGGKTTWRHHWTKRFCIRIP